MLDRVIDFLVFSARMPFTVQDSREHLEELRKELTVVREEQITIRTIVKGCPTCMRTGGHPGYETSP